MRDILAQVTARLIGFAAEQKSDGLDEGYAETMDLVTRMLRYVETAELRDELLAAAKEVGNSQADIAACSDKTELTDRLNRRSRAVNALLVLCDRVAETET